MRESGVSVTLSSVILVTFAVLLVLGLTWGGFGKVMANGVVICLDCIGVI